MTATLRLRLRAQPRIPRLPKVNGRETSRGRQHAKPGRRCGNARDKQERTAAEKCFDIGVVVFGDGAAGHRQRPEAADNRSNTSPTAARFRGGNFAFKVGTLF